MVAHYLALNDNIVLKAVDDAEVVKQQHLINLHIKNFVFNESNVFDITLNKSNDVRWTLSRLCK